MANDHSLNYKLPHTPRSPGAAAAHYFDDTFTRQRRASLGARRPTGLMRSRTRTRSIGNRSDADDKTNGDYEDDDDQSNGPPSRTWTIYRDENGTTPGVPAFEDPEDPINKYVQEQLSRIKSNESQEYAEELAAQVNGAADEL